MQLAQFMTYKYVQSTTEVLINTHAHLIAQLRYDKQLRLRVASSHW